MPPFLRHVSEDVFFSSTPPDNVQTAFDNFYNLALGLLDKFYPERTTTLRSRDPEYITPYIKSLLRKKNRLMRAGRVEKAGAIACRIWKEILKGNRTRLQKYNGRVDAKEMWAAVRQLTGRHSQPVTVDSIDANSLNEHYANISTDTAYTLPPFKHTANQEWARDWVTDFRMFEILDSLKSTSTGLDGLPAWFLRLGAPVFCKTLADLINLYISTSVVLMQWKQERIGIVCVVWLLDAYSTYITSILYPPIYTNWGVQKNFFARSAREFKISTPHYEIRVDAAALSDISRKWHKLHGCDQS